MSSSLIDYTLHLADTTLILSQRNSEWCGHGPILEQDIAITNISLDLLGQARNFYQYAATLMNDGSTEDSLAYLRTEREFKNVLLVELESGDWGQTILRQFLFSQFQHLLFQQLQQNKDEQIAAIAAKAIKETTYHLRWSSEWVIRLGDGTEESHKRMLHAIDELWRYTGELFEAADYETAMGIDLASIKQTWTEKVTAVFAGTFDPITLGHQEMIERASQLFDTVVVAVAMAHHKKTMFNLDERVLLVQQCFASNTAIKVLPFDGLLVDFAKKVGATAMVRGVRGSVDFDYESQLAGMNRNMRPEIDTVLLMPQPLQQCYGQARNRGWYNGRRR